MDGMMTAQKFHHYGNMSFMACIVLLHRHGSDPIGCTVSCLSGGCDRLHYICPHQEVQLQRKQRYEKFLLFYIIKISIQSLNITLVRVIMGSNTAMPINV